MPWGLGWGGVGQYPSRDLHTYVTLQIPKSGKPPPESAPCVRATGILKCVLTTHKNGRKSILVTDGVPYYPKITSENTWVMTFASIVRAFFSRERLSEGFF